MKGFGNLYKSTKRLNKKTILSKEQRIKQAIQLQVKGNIKEATNIYKNLISQGFDSPVIFSNYGIILGNSGKLEDAEKYFRKAIELNPKYALAYSNLGNILKDLGKLQDAELSYRKAVELKPDFAMAHFNLGNILQDLCKLKDAELSYHNAIELDPDLTEAHCNLGNTLRDLRKLQDAEIYTRKAIELNPKYAVAYSNLGNILKDLGKLQDAELSYRKAVELKPDFAMAHNNLGDVLIDLGKFKEILLLSKSTLKIESINQEYKLLTLLRITITNLLKKDFSKTSTYLKETNELINQKKTNEITSEINKKFLFSFSKFITSLYPLLDKENKYSNSKIIPHFGESHCLSFAHQTISISSELNQLQPVLITGGKAWHFANNDNNKWKDSLNQQIKNHTYSKKAFISFGEIDCRKDEGILNYALKNGKDILEISEETISKYVLYMEEIFSPNYSKRYYFGVPAPTRRKKLLDDLDIKRIKLIKLYNSILKKEVLSNGSYFLDVYKLTSDDEGVNNNMHMCDDYHLSPKCLSILFENYLHKGKKENT